MSSRGFTKSDSLGDGANEDVDTRDELSNGASRQRPRDVDDGDATALVSSTTDGRREVR